MADLKMPDLNELTIAGNLTRDPEVREVGGTTLCKLGLANTRRYKTNQGEQKEETLFINVTVWGQSATFCGQYLKKGYPVMVKGRLTQNEWQDNATGETKRIHEINARSVQQLTFENIAGGGNQQAEKEVDNGIGDSLPF